MDYYDGVMIKLDNLNKIEYHKNLVTAGAGCSLIKLSLDTIDKGLSGMECLAGIPGSIGASVAMNAGAYNNDISTILKEATILTPENEVKVMKKEELEQRVRNLEVENADLKRNINKLIEENNILDRERIDAENRNWQMHIKNEKLLTDIIYGLITHTNTEIEKHNANMII